MVVRVRRCETIVLVAIKRAIQMCSVSEWWYADCKRIIIMTIPVLAKIFSTLYKNFNAFVLSV